MLCLLCDSQAAGEVKALEDFYKMLKHEPDRAFYGWERETVVVFIRAYSKNSLYRLATENENVRCWTRLDGPSLFWFVFFLWAKIWIRLIRTCFPLQNVLLRCALLNTMPMTDYDIESHRVPPLLTFLFTWCCRLAHVEKASEALAIDILLISDKLFRYVVLWHYIWISVGENVVFCVCFI